VVEVAIETLNPCIEQIPANWSKQDVKHTYLFNLEWWRIVTAVELIYYWASV
jgi:hypothetical protein